MLQLYLRSCSCSAHIQLLGPGILPHHCNLMHTDGMVTVTPHGPDADTFVDGQRVTETTVLRSGSTLQFGSTHVFKFVDPMYDQGGKKEPGAMMRSRHKSGWEQKNFIQWQCFFFQIYLSPPVSFLSFLSTSSTAFVQRVFPKMYAWKEHVIADERERGWGLELADRRRDEGKEGESKVWGWVDGENGGNERRGRVEELWGYGRLAALLNWWRRVWSSHCNAPVEDRNTQRSR